MIRYWLLKISSWFQPKKRAELKFKGEEYRKYFSEQMLKHQVDCLDLYQPEYRAEIPQNPETLKRF